MKQIVIILFSLFIFPVSARTIVACSHAEICRLAEQIFQEHNQKDLEFQSLVQIIGDPHEYEPTALEVKNLIKAPALISGPKDLNPWIKKINYQRSKIKDQKTINLSLDKDVTTHYPGSTLEALSHFWLYPKIYCSLKRQLQVELVAKNFIANAIKDDRNKCSTEEMKITSELKATIESLKYPLILTHDALLPLLHSLNPKAVIAAIKGSGHHQEATPQTVKKLYDALNSPKVIWIEESGINVPQNILSKKRSGDLTVKIDTAKSSNSNYFQILYSLNDKLKAIKQ